MLEKTTENFSKLMSDTKPPNPASSVNTKQDKYPRKRLKLLESIQSFPLNWGLLISTNYRKHAFQNSDQISRSVFIQFGVSATLIRDFRDPPTPLPLLAMPEKILSPVNDRNSTVLNKESWMRWFPNFIKDIDKLSCYKKYRNHYIANINILLTHSRPTLNSENWQYGPRWSLDLNKPKFKSWLYFLSFVFMGRLFNLTKLQVSLT